MSLNEPIARVEVNTFCLTSVRNPAVSTLLCTSVSLSPLAAAIHRSDVNGGGGIYQVLEFNGRLYVVVCTGNAGTRDEQTGTLRSFAIYVGECTSVSLSPLAGSIS